MKKILALLLAAFTVTACLASCTSADDGKGDVTTAGGNSEVTTAADEEELPEGQKYALNPILTRSYRKNDTEVQFRFDGKVKADTDLTKCVYVSETDGGEPIAFAKTVTPHSEGGYSEKWVATFEGPLPENFFLSIKVDGGKDPEIKTAFVTEDGKGVYADKTLADGVRYTAVKNGADRIIDFKWTEFSVNPDDEEVTYGLPDPANDMIIAHADNMSYLAIIRSGPGGYIEATFTGNVVEVLNYVENDSVTNALHVLIDGVEVEILDDRAPFDKTYEGLSDGEHTIRLVVGEESSSEGQNGDNKYMFYISGIKFAEA